MLNKKMVALIAAGALAACLALVGCGGSQAASSSASAAASSNAASSAAASASAGSASTAASSAAASAAAASTSAQAASATSASAASYIGDQAAMDAALGDAGFSASQVTELEVGLDLDDAVVHYDVNFKQGGLEYDYDIDASSGAILTSKSEVDN